MVSDILYDIYWDDSSSMLILFTAYMSNKMWNITRTRSEVKIVATRKPIRTIWSAKYPPPFLPSRTTFIQTTFTWPDPRDLIILLVGLIRNSQLGGGWVGWGWGGAGPLKGPQWTGTWPTKWEKYLYSRRKMAWSKRPPPILQRVEMAVLIGLRARSDTADLAPSCITAPGPPIFVPIPAWSIRHTPWPPPPPAPAYCYCCSSQLHGHPGINGSASNSSTQRRPCIELDHTHNDISMEPTYLT